MSWPSTGKGRFHELRQTGGSTIYSGSPARERRHETDIQSSAAIQGIVGRTLASARRANIGVAAQVHSPVAVVRSPPVLSSCSPMGLSRAPSAFAVASAFTPATEGPQRPRRQEGGKGRPPFAEPERRPFRPCSPAWPFPVCPPHLHPRSGDTAGPCEGWRRSPSTTAESRRRSLFSSSLCSLPARRADASVRPTMP